MSAIVPEARSAGQILTLYTTPVVYVALDRLRKRLLGPRPDHRDRRSQLMGGVGQERLLAVRDHGRGTERPADQQPPDHDRDQPNDQRGPRHPERGRQVVGGLRERLDRGDRGDHAVGPFDRAHGHAHTLASGPVGGQLQLSALADPLVGPAGSGRIEQVVGAGDDPAAGIDHRDRCTWPPGRPEVAVRLAIHHQVAGVTLRVGEAAGRERGPLDQTVLPFLPPVPRLDHEQDDQHQQNHNGDRRVGGGQSPPQPTQLGCGHEPSTSR